MPTIEIHRMLGQRDEQVGDLLYHNHELLLVTRVGKWHIDKRGRNTQTTKFRRIGRVNLDRQFRRVSDSEGGR
jgi:hypothetical protein